MIWIKHSFSILVLLRHSIIDNNGISIELDMFFATIWCCNDAVIMIDSPSVQVAKHWEALALLLTYHPTIFDQLQFFFQCFLVLDSRSTQLLRVLQLFIPLSLISLYPITVSIDIHSPFPKIFLVIIVFANSYLSLLAADWHYVIVVGLTYTVTGDMVMNIFNKMIKWLVIN